MAQYPTRHVSVSFHFHSCLSSESSLDPGWLLRRLVLLDACVKRVINECGTLCGFIIILRQKGKSTTDQLQPTSCRMIVQLACDVRCLHGVGYFQENGVMRQPLMHQRRKRT